MKLTVINEHNVLLKTETADCTCKNTKASTAFFNTLQLNVN